MRERNSVEESVRSFAARAAAKMRRQGLACGALTVFIETNPFRPQDRQYNASQSVSLAVPTADTGKLIAAAQYAIDVIWRDGYLCKKAGVMLLELEKAALVSPGLFDAADTPKSQARMKMVDAINARFGRDKISFGTIVAPRAWQLRRDLLSSRYTTEWDELLRV